MAKRTSHCPRDIAVSACATLLQANGEIQLMPAGRFKARDGRPHGLSGWVLDDTDASALLTRLALRQDDLVIDYEHQTLNAEKNGKPAPAAGWFKGADVVFRPGEGLFVVPQWTAAAKASIDAGEYRYFSPVIVFNKRTGQVLDLQMGAVTNYAAIDGMGDLQARAAAKFLTTQPDEDTSMEELLKLLGLAPGTPEDQAVTALKAVLDKQTEQTQQIAALTAEVANKDEAIAAAKAQTPDSAMEAITALQAEVAALKAGQAEGEVTSLVDKALEDGRLVPAMKDWATDLGKSDLAALKGYLEKAEPIAALRGKQTGGKDLDGKRSELNETDLAVCTAMGIDEDAYKATLAAG
jgi:phage I-like protein